MKYMKSEWMKVNIREIHGALDTLIQQHWINEGDTPSWLHLVNNGLISHFDYKIGGWGAYDDKAKNRTILQTNFSRDTVMQTSITDAG
jgi:hypothetical protein